MHAGNIPTEERYVFELLFVFVCSEGERAQENESIESTTLRQGVTELADSGNCHRHCVLGTKCISYIRYVVYPAASLSVMIVVEFPSGHS